MFVEGIPSGDHECWCLLVTKEEFRRINGGEPDEEFDVGPFAKPGSEYRYKVYPCAILGIPYDAESKKEVYVISAQAVMKKDFEAK